MPDRDSAATGPLAIAQGEGPGSLAVGIVVGGAHILADEPPQAGGGGAGPTPHELLAAALSACTAMTLRLYADRKRWPLARVRVEVAHRREADATPADLFWRRIVLEGALDSAQSERLMQIAQRCPVHRTLAAGARIETLQATA